MTQNEAMAVAQEITALTGRAAQPVQDDSPKRRGAWVVQLSDTGECVINGHAADFLAPPSMRPRLTA